MILHMVLTIFSDKPKKSKVGMGQKWSKGPHFLGVRDPGRTPDRSSSPETAGWRKSNLKSSATLANLQCFMVEDGNHMVLVCV